jgi:hypothetical protein
MHNFCLLKRLLVCPQETVRAKAGMTWTLVDWYREENGKEAKE